MGMTVLQAQVIKPKNVVIKNKKMNVVRVEKNSNHTAKKRFVMITTTAQKRNGFSKAK